MQILAVRVGRVGDTVMMTPALQAILECHPGVELTILASPEGKSLLKDFSPAIKDIWTWDRHGFIQSYLDKQSLLAKIASSHFDIIYCFDTSPRIASLFKHATGRFIWFSGSDTHKHTARHYLDLVVSSCNQAISDYYNFLPVNDEDARQLDDELASLGITQDDTVVMMHPTFSGYSKLGLRKRKAKIRKLWPAENYSRLGNLLSKTKTGSIKNIKPIIALLPDELPLGKRIVSNSDGKITLLASKPEFGRYKALLKRANLLLTPDSGPMHIASALNTPIVAFFSMKDPGDCGPYMDPSLYTVLRSDDPIRGISTITVDTVFNTIITALDRASANKSWPYTDK